MEIAKDRHQQQMAHAHSETRTAVQKSVSHAEEYTSVEETRMTADDEEQTSTSQGHTRRVIQREHISAS